MDSPAFESGTGFLLSRLGSLAGRAWYRMLTDLHLTPHQHAVLLVLRQGQPMGQQQLAGVIGVDQRNLLPILEGLESLGMIVREMDGADRRRRILTLTEAGSVAAEQLFASGQQIEEQFLAGLSVVDRTELNRILLALDRSLAA